MNKYKYKKFNQVLTIPKANKVGYMRTLYICKGERGIRTSVLAVRVDNILPEDARHFTVPDTSLCFHLGI